MSVVIKTAVSEADKFAFRAFAKANGKSESEALRELIYLALHSSESNLGATAVEADEEQLKPIKVTIRIPRFMLGKVRDQARKKGMFASSWISSLVQSNVLHSPVLSADSLEAVRASNRQLAAIGRNINQIARALNESFYETDRVKLQLLSDLQGEIEHHRAVLLRLGNL